jgi:hypothetical protein
MPTGAALERTTTTTTTILGLRRVILAGAPVRSYTTPTSTAPTPTAGTIPAAGLPGEDFRIGLMGVTRMLGTVPAAPFGDTINLGATAVGAVRTDGEEIPMHGAVHRTDTGVHPTDTGVHRTVSMIRGARPLASTTRGAGTTLGVGGLLMDGMVPTTVILGTTVDSTTTVVPQVAVVPPVEDLQLNPDARPPVWWLATMRRLGPPSLLRIAPDAARYWAKIPPMCGRPWTIRTGKFRRIPADHRAKQAET